MKMAQKQLQTLFFFFRRASSSSSLRPAHICFSSCPSYDSKTQSTNTSTTNTSTITSSSLLSEEEIEQINLLIPRLCASNHLKEATNLITTALIANPPLKSLSLSIFIHSLSIQPDLTLPMYFLNRLNKHSSPTAQSFALAFAKMLVSFFFQKGQPKKALKISQWVSRPDLSPFCVVDSGYYAVLVRGFCRNDMVVEALKVLKVMVEKGSIINGGEEIRMWVYRGLLREARIKEAQLLMQGFQNLGEDDDGGEAAHNQQLLKLLDHMIATWG